MPLQWHNQLPGFAVFLSLPYPYMTKAQHFIPAALYLSLFVIYNPDT
jgi:hypothetical protein